MGDPIDQVSKALVVFDEPNTAGSIAKQLQTEGIQPCLAFTEEQARRSVHLDRFSIVLLGPHMGPGVVRRLRPLVDVAILSCRNRDDGTTRDDADYEMPESATVGEIVARALLLLQTTAPVDLPADLVWGPLRLDVRRRRALWRGTVVPLTPIQFRIMEVLVMETGSVVTVREIGRRVWKAWLPGDDAKVRTHISRIRKVIGDVGTEPQFLLTVRGEGFRVADVELVEPELHWDKISMAGASRPTDRG